MREVYLDYSATTPVDSSVLKKMMPFLKGDFGNPSSLHKLGREAKMVIEKSREDIAEILKVKSQEIIFTGSGTEADNLAILGIARANKEKGEHIIISKIEHPAVNSPTNQLKKKGFDIDYLSVSDKGLVDLDELKKLLRPDTILVSIIYANNEIGVIQPISEISKIIKEKSDAVFHTDACQASCYLDLNTKNLGVDAMTINGSKVYGPKGVGCLFVSENTKIEPIITGGGQEMQLRGGTENTASIVGMTEALKLAIKLKDNENKRLLELQKYFLKELSGKISDWKLNGHPEERLPNNINISFSGVEGESLLLILDKYGIYASTGSACASKNLEPSSTLLAIGAKPEQAHESIRFSMGRSTTKKDLDYLLKTLSEAVKKLREISTI